MRETISQLRRDLGLTVIWVTHYMEEVREVGDRVYLLLDGRIADEDRRRLRAFLAAVHAEVAGSGVKVSGIYPSAVDTCWIIGNASSKVS